jgi:hypothetical protein
MNLQLILVLERFFTQFTCNRNSLPWKIRLLFKVRCCLKEFLHTSHERGSSALWFNRWTNNTYICLKGLLQNWHANRNSLPWMNEWMCGQGTLWPEGFLKHISWERMLSTVILTDETPTHTSAWKVYFKFHMQKVIHSHEWINVCSR